MLQRRSEVAVAILAANASTGQGGGTARAEHRAHGAAGTGAAGGLTFTGRTHGSRMRHVVCVTDLVQHRALSPILNHFSVVLYAHTRTHAAVMTSVPWLTRFALFFFVRVQTCTSRSSSLRTFSSRI